MMLRSTRALLLVMFPVSLGLGVTSCFPYSKLTNDRPDPVVRKIADATILDMKVHLHKQPGLCPGREGKLYVNANVQWPNAKPVVRSLGNDVDSLAPSAFTATGPLLKGDANGHLFPNADVLKSVEAGFRTKIVYTLNPLFSFEVTFPPEYSCYSGWYDDGAAGDNGGGGDGGANANPGGHGGNGGNGLRGGAGRPGGRVTAYVTVVSTRYYPRLLAVIANDHFFLAPADRELQFGAVGGQGGSGGGGGGGGAGGDQPVKDIEVFEDGQKTTVRVPDGSPGNGGNGGNGGTGGDGGRGGTVEVIYDNAFPELRTLITTDVRGGAGGYAGAGGGGGAGGGSTAERDAAYGNAGGNGESGNDGQPSGPGRATVRPGSVASMFRLRGIAIAGTAEARALQANPPPPASAFISATRAAPSPPDRSRPVRR